MTAADHNLRDGSAAIGAPSSVTDVVVRHIERICRTAIDGRRAARALADWAQRFDLGEAELQVLWNLQTAADAGQDQTTLARELAFSAAQVSATVERVRARGWICQQPAAGDRRRHLWQLSATGRDFLHQMLANATLLNCGATVGTTSVSIDRQGREAAA